MCDSILMQIKDNMYIRQWNWNICCLQSSNLKNEKCIISFIFFPFLQDNVFNDEWKIILFPIQQFLILIYEQAFVLILGNNKYIILDQYTS